MKNFLKGFFIGLLSLVFVGSIAIAQSVLTVPGGGTSVSSTTRGDLLYGASSTAFTNLSIGSPGQVLSISNGLPYWATTSTEGGSGVSTTLLADWNNFSSTNTFSGLIFSQGQFVHEVKNISADYTMRSDDFFISLNSSGGSFTVTLPLVSEACINGFPQHYLFKQLAFSNPVNIVANDVDGIDFNGTFRTMNKDNGTLELISDCTNNWQIIGTNDFSKDLTVPGDLTVNGVQNNNGPTFNQFSNSYIFGAEYTKLTTVAFSQTITRDDHYVKVIDSGYEITLPPASPGADSYGIDPCDFSGGMGQEIYIKQTPIPSDGSPNYVVNTIVTPDGSDTIDNVSGSQTMTIPNSSMHLVSNCRNGWSLVGGRIDGNNDFSDRTIIQGGEYINAKYALSGGSAGFNNNEQYLFVNSTVQPTSVSLPSAASSCIADGYTSRSKAQHYIVKDYGGEANFYNITLVPDGTDTITGPSIIDQDYGYIDLISDCSSSWTVVNTYGASQDMSVQHNLSVGFSHFETGGNTNPLTINAANSGNTIVLKDSPFVSRSSLDPDGTYLSIQNSTSQDIFSIDTTGAIMVKNGYSKFGTSTLNLGIVTITPTSTTDNALVIRGIPNFTSKYLDIQNSNGISLMMMSSTGFVGIGTSTPRSILQVENTNTNTTTIWIGSLTKPGQFCVGDADKVGATCFYGNNGTGFTYSTSTY